MTGGIGHRKTERRSTSSRSVAPGWDGLYMRVMFIIVSVVIEVIDQHGIPTFTFEAHAPVSENLRTIDIARRLRFES